MDEARNHNSLWTETLSRLNDLHREVRQLRAEVQKLTAEPDAPDLLTVEEATARLRLSERTVRSLISSGELPSVKIKRRRLVPAEALEAFIHSHLNGG
jgi:excisionase family DNA binding protein